MSEELPVLQQTSARRVSRRELAQKLLSGLAAGLVAPALSPLHPIHRHLLNGSLLNSADEALAAGSGYKPAFLSPPQMASLDNLAEALIPGSHKAQSAEFIDLLLSVDSPEHQQNFTASLAAMETSSTKAFHKGAAALTHAELQQLLEAALAADSPDHAHFENLKDWAIGAFYSSEIGMRELGWTPDRVFPTYPGCAHAAEHS